MILAIPKRRRGKRRNANPVPSVILHLPQERKLGGMDFGYSAIILFAVGVGIYTAAHLPPPKVEVEENLVMVAEEIPPPPVEVREPPKPPPPPPEPVVKTVIPEVAPPPVFGLQAEETSESGDMEVANGNTLAAPPDDIVREAPPPLPPRPPEPIALDRAPAFIKQVLAEYPEWAQDQGVEAVVLVWVTIDAQGQVVNASIKRGAAKDFDRSALQAAKASLFQPLVQNGIRLPSRFVVTYDFALNG